MSGSLHKRFGFLVVAALMLIVSLLLVNCGGGGGGGGSTTPTPTPVATYTVTYDENGSDSGSVPVDTATYAQGQTVTILGNTGTLVKSGYSFVGWNTKADGTGTTYGQAQTFLMGAANVTLYAKWTTNPAYTVTYNGNNNTGGSVPIDTTNYEQGQTVMVLENTGTLVKTGYSFVGWNTHADGTGTAYASGQTFAMGSANVTLYAKWTANVTYTVIYNGNNNTGGSVPTDTINYEQGQTVTVLGNTGNLVRTGNFFTGWNTKADGTGTTYAQGQTFLIGAANVTLYARWTTNPVYTVTYDNNGSTSGSVPIDTTFYEQGQTVTVQGNPGSLVRTGYSFTGWNTQADGLGTTYAPAQTFVMGAANVTLFAKWTAIWTGTKQLGVAGAATQANGVAVDGSGNVYTAGWTQGGLDGNSLTGTTDLFLTKYDASGNRVRTRQLGVAGAATQANAVAVDVSGNVYTAGSTTGGLDGNTLAGTMDLFLTKYDASGNKVWTRQLGVFGAATQANSLAVDGSGIYVAGSTTGGLDSNSLTGIRDFFVTLYDSAGTKVRTRQLGALGADTQATSVAVDGNGNVYVAGSTTGGLDGNFLTGTKDFFVIMYDSSGNKVRTRQLGVSGAATQANSVAVDGSGNMYVTGNTAGGLDGNTQMGSTDLFLTLYNSAGNKVRTKQLGLSGTVTDARGLVVDGNGDAWVTGVTSGALLGASLTGTTDLFLTKYDPLGNPLRPRQLGAVGTATQANGIALDSSGDMFVAGYTFGGLDGNTLKGIDDSFVVKYDATGNKQ